MRKALSLLIDRQAINDNRAGRAVAGRGQLDPGRTGRARSSGRRRRTDVAQARKLMADAGVGDGFDISAITPLPPNFSWAEQILDPAAGREHQDHGPDDGAGRLLRADGPRAEPAQGAGDAVLLGAR